MTQLCTTEGLFEYSREMHEGSNTHKATPPEGERWEVEVNGHARTVEYITPDRHKPWIDYHLGLEWKPGEARTVGATAAHMLTIVTND